LNGRFFAVAVLSVLTLSCAKREEPRRISAEAAAAFGRAQADGMGGSMVLDLDAFRELGFRPGAGQDQAGGLLVDLGVQSLAAFAAELKDDPSAAVIARSAVLLRLVADWAKAPGVQRVGVLVQLDPARLEGAADGALVLVAVKEGEAANRELLQGLGASVRAAAGRELVLTEQGNLCVAKDADPDLPFQLCVRPGPGYFALGTVPALATLAAGSTPPPPAPREPGALLRFRARMPGVGKVELSVEGRGALRVAGALEADDPAMAEQVERTIQEGLKQLDGEGEKRRAVMAKALVEVQGALGKDAETPAALKGAASGATAEKLLDPRGELAALRSSFRVARSGKSLTAELTVPEAQVRRFSAVDPGMTMVATTGILAAVAIPNFIKYQCRAKAAEGSVTLKAAWTSMEAYRAEKGKYPAHPDQLDLAAGSHYPLCMRSGCTASLNPAAAAACEEALADAPGGPKAPALCAAAEVADGDLDVWLIEASGAPSHVRIGCR
jgi:type IV pilus assembly protein PilA